MSGVPELVVEHRPALERWLGREAGPLLRYESAEDLAQGAVSRALEAAAGFRWQGPDEARAWLFRIARRHLDDRRRHWLAFKRDGARVLRFEITRSGGGGSAVALPHASQTGPSTFALRREQLVIAARALALLPPRDRDLVRWAAGDVPIRDQADRLELGYEAAVQARKRALDRFRRTYELVLRSLSRT